MKKFSFFFFFIFFCFLPKDDIAIYEILNIYNKLSEN
jgi:hypothetical protein